MRRGEGGGWLWRMDPGGRQREGGVAQDPAMGAPRREWALLRPGWVREEGS